MLQSILRWLTIALLAVSFSGSHSSANPLEDSSAVSAERDACMKELFSLRDEAVARFKLIRAASERHAPPREVCKLLGNYGQSQIRMVEYIEANRTKCAVPPWLADRLKTGREDTETRQKKICAEPAVPVGDFDDIGAPPLVR